VFQKKGPRESRLIREEGPGDSEGGATDRGKEKYFRGDLWMLKKRSQWRETWERTYEPSLDVCQQYGRLQEKVRHNKKVHEKKGGSSKKKNPKLKKKEADCATEIAI